jgi:hypothetical protein
MLRIFKLVLGGSMSKKIDLRGKTFNRLTAIKEAGKTKHGQVIWLCKCSCGNTREALAGQLKNGAVKSCGCLRKETVKQNRKKNKSKKADKEQREQTLKTCTNCKNDTTTEDKKKGLWCKIVPEPETDKSGNCPKWENEPGYRPIPSIETGYKINLRN